MTQDSEDLDLHPINCLEVTSLRLPRATLAKEGQLFTKDLAVEEAICGKEDSFLLPEMSMSFKILVIPNQPPAVAPSGKVIVLD